MRTPWWRPLLSAIFDARGPGDASVVVSLSPKRALSAISESLSRSRLPLETRWRRSVIAACRSEEARCRSFGTRASRIEDFGRTFLGCPFYFVCSCLVRALRLLGIRKLVVWFLRSVRDHYKRRDAIGTNSRTPKERRTLPQGAREALQLGFFLPRSS